MQAAHDRFEPRICTRFFFFFFRIFVLGSNFAQDLETGIPNLPPIFLIKPY